MTDDPAVRPKHVMVVDDEAAAREMVGDYLELHGFTVTLCEGGRSLRRMLARQTPDIVLLDLNMPEEDGLSIIRFIKQTSAVPIILLTATASPIDRVVGLEMGADDYLTKPCELRELLARIRTVLRRVHWSAQRANERRLAAIVSFDQVGFSRAIQRNETATLAALDRVFAEIIEPSLPRYRGLLFKKLGDGALVEFASVVDAVEWSVYFQRTIFALPAMVLDGVGIRFRLGIAIGDIVIDNADRQGEAVALAVRMQEIARAGTVALSDYTYRLAAARTGHEFVDLGLCPLKNIVDPMRVWEWSPERGASAQSSVTASKT